MDSRGSQTSAEAAAAAFPHGLHRAGVVFLLDIVALVRGRRHPLDALLLAVIVQANDASPDPDAPRPISINALANSLALPFESVRRRVHRLAAEGLCKASRAGVLAPGVIARPAYAAGMTRAYDRLRAFHAELQAMDALPDLPPPAAGATPVPVRVVARLLADHALRVIDVALAVFDDLVDALILLETFCANTEDLPFIGAPGADDGPFRVYDDAQRKPVGVSALARRSGFALETVRRHAETLIDQGLMRRVGRGYIVPATALAGPAVVRFALENAVQTRRMFAQLAQLGVLDAWERDRASAAGAA
jgi:DNA-binding Lrp family transcriptional regulator